MEVLVPEVWPLFPPVPSVRHKLSFSSSNLAPLFLRFFFLLVIIPTTRASIFFPSHPTALSSPVEPLPPSSLWLPVSPMFSPSVSLLGATALGSGSETAPPHIVCMLYRQPNGGNQRTQMRLDPARALHSNRCAFH